MKHALAFTPDFHSIKVMRVHMRESVTCSLRKTFESFKAPRPQQKAKRISTCHQLKVGRMSHTFDRGVTRHPEEVPSPSYESVTRAPSEHSAAASNASSAGSQEFESQSAAHEQLPTYEEATRRNARATPTAQQQAPSQIPTHTTRTDRTTRTETYSDGNCSITSHFTGNSNNGVRFGSLNGSIFFHSTSDGGAVIMGIGSGSNISGSQVTSMPDGSFIFTTGGGGRGQRRDN